MKFKIKAGAYFFYTNNKVCGCTIIFIFVSILTMQVLREFYKIIVNIVEIFRIVRKTQTNV